ncbi:AraC family transcriptional regulator [Mycetocola zhadangensis]|uniref:AraC family transcriptional regulator n=1 Tax=Mycetocola zhadangensis TaxID=1164595 RepID=A0A3L7J260_9MICO|nr:AraC family transcriptional regulator [Mycetocola zhadangensis]RLQ84653.1 AraC family transcriptional regulator [Mycetocola zhadangensis]GGE95288.1 AraC family transcriptional regulator [Mycetocola zhadangensis]
MDPLSRFFTEPRARDAFSLRVVMSPPFAIDVRDEAALTLIVPVRGSSWLIPSSGPAQSLSPGQSATVRGPEPYRISDAPDTEPTVIIGIDQTCRTPDGDSLETTLRHGVRTWGNDPTGDTVLLIGTYPSDAAVGQLVTSALPHVAIFDEDETDATLVALLERELSSSDLGQGSALDRLLDLLLLHVVRAFARRPDGVTPSWVNGAGDPVVASALTLMHEDPAAGWTVASLADRVHVSRAKLAARFSATVGQPPMSYLSNWRLALAADRLASSDVTTATVAAEVGYSSAFTFSTAFSRTYGQSPTAYRRARRSAVASEA